MEPYYFDQDLNKALKLTNLSAPAEKEKVTLDSFLLLSMIGKGSYANVALVRKKSTQQIYALKIIKKSLLQRPSEKNKLATERSVMIEIDHPFIIKLHYAFQNEHKLYFAMEYCHGGELFNLLQKRRTFTEDHLKPENVLIDKDGYIRISDFGLSKKGVKGDKGVTSICGTPEYLAPEVLSKMSYGKPIDWWSFGAIIYEMLAGLPPFYTPDREELFELIKFAVLKYPASLSSNAKDLLDGLLQKNPLKRLGNGQNGLMEIMNHPWFESIDWNALLRKEIQAPFVPKINHETDVSNFDPEFTETSIESLKDAWIFDKKIGTFSDWSYNPDSVRENDFSVPNRDGRLD